MQRKEPTAVIQFNESKDFVGLGYYKAKKDIVFRFIIEYSSLRDFVA
jgi:hypothetical protein